MNTNQLMHYQSGYRQCVADLVRLARLTSPDEVVRGMASDLLVLEPKNEDAKWWANERERLVRPGIISP